MGEQDGSGLSAGLQGVESLLEALKAGSVGDQLVQSKHSPEVQAGQEREIPPRLATPSSDTQEVLILVKGLERVGNR